MSTTQWVIAASLLVLAIIIGIWVGKDAEVMDESQDLNSSNNQKGETSVNELELLRNQLQERDRELKDAKEEAELTLHQLHELQKELDHYFLKSRELDLKTNSLQTISPAQLAQLQRIKSKLQLLFVAMPQTEQVNQAQIASTSQLNQLLLRQQESLRRFRAFITKA